VVGVDTHFRSIKVDEDLPRAVDGLEHLVQTNDLNMLAHSNACRQFPAARLRRRAAVNAVIVVSLLLAVLGLADTLRAAESLRE
jgi:hypothetical protein